MLANLTVARKPARGARVCPDPFAGTTAAAQALGVEAAAVSDLDGLRELHTAVRSLVDRLLSGQAPTREAEHLSRLAEPSHAHARLQLSDDGRLRDRLDWSDPTLVAGLARRAVLELGTVDPRRLRRCQRTECDLVFYDTTRSNTRRWHAESPCGQRERQRRLRTSTASRGQSAGP